MDIEESRGGSGDYAGEEGFEASRLVSVHEHPELEVVLEPFALQTSTNPNFPSNQDSYPQSSAFSAPSEASRKRSTGVGKVSRFPGSEGHSKDLREMARGGREKGTAGGSALIMRGTARAKTLDSPTAFERERKLEAVMQEWLMNPHEEEEDSESADIPLCQPTRPLQSRDQIKTPTFTAEKEATFAGFEGETDSFAVSRTEDSSPLPSFQKARESFPTPPQPVARQKVEFTHENSEEHFSFNAKSRTGREVKPEEFSFKARDVGKTSPAGEPRQGILTEESKASAIPASDSLPEPQIDDPQGLSLHKPAASSALMEELVRARGNTTPPASSSSSRGFRRFKLPEGHLKGLQESDISARLGAKPADSPHSWGKKADLEGQMEPQDRPFPPAAGEESQGTPLKTLLSEAEPLVQGRTDSTRPVDSPDYPSTSYQLVSNASPDSRPRPRQLIKEFEGSAMRLTKESLASAVKSERKDRSDGEEEGAASLPFDMQLTGPPEKHPHSGATKLPIERAQKATTAEKEPMRSEAKLKAIDRTAAARTRKEAGERQGKQEEDKDDSGHTWNDQDTSLDPIFAHSMDSSNQPISSNSFPMPLVARAPEVEESKVPASVIEKALIFKKQPFVFHSDIWPLFLQLHIPANFGPVTLETPQKSSCLTRCFRAAPVELDDALKDQLRRIYALAGEGLGENAFHLLVLMNVWKFFTKSKTDCRRCGQHWGRLGFQGTDPGKELGQIGVFGLLQLLFLASNMPEEADAIFTYSRQPQSTFPFAKVSLRISAITIETLRTGKLNKLIVQRGEAYRIVRTKQVDLLYAGLFVRWFEEYRRRGMIAAGIGVLNESILAEAKSHPERLISAIQQRYKQL